MPFISTQQHWISRMPHDYFQRGVLMMFAVPAGRHPSGVESFYGQPNTAVAIVYRKKNR